MVILIYGMSMWHWGLEEMQGVFIAIMLVIAIIGRLSPDRVAIEFGTGAASLTVLHS